MISVSDIQEVKSTVEMLSKEFLKSKSEKAFAFLGMRMEYLSRTKLLLDQECYVLRFIKEYKKFVVFLVLFLLNLKQLLLFLKKLIPLMEN